jgi:hypothetical protein
MTRRFIPLLLAGLVALAGFALAQDPPAGQDEPPVRLKKKKPRGDEKPEAKPEEKKKDDKKEDKKSEKKEEPREAEPVMPQEEEKEVLQRVVKNVHDVGERLAKNDLGEGTRQTQRDILKDIESLINRNENPPQSDDQDQGGGGGGGGDDQNPMNNKDNQGGGGGGGGQKSQSKQGSRGQKSQGGAGGGGQKSQGKAGNSGGSGKQRSQGNSGGGNAGTQPGGGSGTSRQKPGDRSAGGGGEKPGGRNGKNGNGGGGGDKGERAMNKNADLYKDVWGHLPETLRAQMDAYSNPQPFLPKYDELIKRYYRTIAEQGRRKGE